MTPFYARFRDLAFAETRSVATRKYSLLPDANFGLMEFYCNEPACDCRRVLLQVVKQDSGAQVWATISFGWETPAFYQKWSYGDPDAASQAGSSLDPLGEQSILSGALLDLFRNLLQTDADYVQRLARHYDLAKAADTKPTRSRVKNRAKKC